MSRLAAGVTNTDEQAAVDFVGNVGARAAITTGRQVGEMSAFEFVFSLANLADMNELPRLVVVRKLLL